MTLFQKVRRSPVATLGTGLAALAFSDAAGAGIPRDTMSSSVLSVMDEEHTVKACMEVGAQHFYGRVRESAGAGQDFIAAHEIGQFKTEAGERACDCVEDRVSTVPGSCQTEYKIDETDGLSYTVKYVRAKP